MGTTVSFSKIENKGTNEDDLKEKELDEPSIETLLLLFHLLMIIQKDYL